MFLLFFLLKPQSIRFHPQHTTTMTTPLFFSIPIHSYQVRQRSVWIVLAILVCGSCQPPRSSSSLAPSPPNIIFILADDLGWGDPQSYNPESRIPTPHIDQLAAEGIRFTDAHSPSAVCTPTRYGVLTGRYAWRTELKSGVLWGYDPPLIAANRMTVASLLKSHGYQTGCVGKWHLGLPWQPLGEEVIPSRKADRVNAGRNSTNFLQPLGEGGPNDLGFDEFFGIPASLDMAPYVYLHNQGAEAWPTDSTAGSGRSEAYDQGFWRAGPAAPNFDFQQVLNHLTDQALGFIEQAAPQDTPFFLYFPLTAPHTPWVPTEEFRGKSQAGKYGDFVAQVDHVVGRVLQMLEQTGEADNTLIMFSSDNGSHIDHIGAQYNHAANADWRGQKADIHEGGHRVPFLARWPQKIPAGAVSDELLCLTDLIATCAAIVGDTLPDTAGEDSYNMLPALLGETPEIRDAIVHHSLSGVFSLRRGRWKLIQGRGSGGFTKPQKIEVGPEEAQGQLYDLVSDPGETNNLYDKNPEVVLHLTGILKQYQAAGRSR